MLELKQYNPYEETGFGAELRKLKWFRLSRSAAADRDRLLNLTKPELLSELRLPPARLRTTY